MPSFPRAPFLAPALFLAALRTVSLDEAEHFLQNRMAVARCAPRVFGFIPECRSTSLRKQHSASPESAQRFRYSLSPIICGAEKASNVGITAYPDDFSAMLAGVSHHL